MVELKTVKRIALRVAALAVLGIAVSGFHPVQAALALKCPAKYGQPAETAPGRFGWGFICPRPYYGSPPSTQNSPDVDLVGSPAGFGGPRVAAVPYRTVKAGTLIDFTTSFHSTHSPSSYDGSVRRDVIMWSIIDANDSVTQTDGGAINPGSGTLTGCPGTPGQAQVDFVAESPITGGVTCGESAAGNEGKMIYWTLSGVGPNQTHTRTFQLQLPNQNPGTESDICVRTYISVWEHNTPPADALPANSADNLKYGVARSHRECYRMITQLATVHVRSSGPEEEDSVTNHYGTGRDLPGVVVSESNECPATDPANPSAVVPADNNAKVTDGAGNVRFLETVGNAYCLRASQFATGPDGTRYILRTDDSVVYDNNGQQLNSFENQVAGVYCDDRAGPPDTSTYVTDCAGRQAFDNNGDDFEFIYDPISDPPIITKLDPLNNTPVLTASAPSCQANKDNPGCRVDYTMIISNPHDSTFTNTTIIDNIPLNMRQDPGFTPVIDEFSMHPLGPAPGYWVVPTFNFTVPPPPGTPLPFVYGGGPFGYQSGEAHLQYNSPSGLPAPGSIYLQYSEMPAYSEVVIRWHGYVKPTSGIGVYPANPNSRSNPYCTAPEVGSYVQPDENYIAECEDLGITGEGLQGVANIAFSEVDNNDPNGLKPSNLAYRPIPGNGINCVSKNSTAPYDDPAAIINPGGPPCPVQTATAGFAGNPPPIQIFNDTNPNFNNFQFHMTVASPQAGAPYWGPSHYDLFDQQCPANSVDENACIGMDPAFTAYSNFGPSQDTPPGPPSGYDLDPYGQSTPNNLYGRMRARMLPSFNGTANISDYYLNVSVNAGAGGRPPCANTANASCQVNNKSCARVIDFSTLIDFTIDFHHSSTLCSNTVSQYFVTIDSPIFDTNKSNVGVGGNPSNPLTACTYDPRITGAVPFPEDPRIVTSAGSTARYFVSAANGTIRGFSSVSLSPPGSNAQYHAYCYPDLAAAADRYLATTAGSGHGRTVAALTDGTLADGDVVVINGNHILPAPLTVNKRFTILVRGSLTIKNNITNTAALSGSVGVIADNIFIDPAVTQLDGYYYAKGGTNTGIINTCAGDGTTPLSGPPANPGTTKTLGNNIRDDENDPFLRSQFYQPKQCKNRLQVNGLLLANTFRFNRTGKYPNPNGTAYPIAEFIQALGQAYVLTPPGFSDINTNAINPTGLGSQLPRF